MKINECIMTQSTCYNEAGRVPEHFGIVVHSTGVNNPWVSRYVQPSEGDPNRVAIINELGTNIYGNDWNHTDVNAGVHAFIGKKADGAVSVWQVLPWTNVAWGVWRGKLYKADSPCYANEKRTKFVCYTKEDNLLPDSVYNTLAEKGVAPWVYNGQKVWIDSLGLASFNNDPPYYQFEICEDSLTDEKYFYDCMDSAQELCAYLCEKFNLPVDKVVSHKESFDLGYGSAHGDPDHWLKRFGKDMNWFRKKVAEKMGKTTVFKYGDKVKLLSDKTINGLSLASFVTDGRPLWVIDSDEIRTSVTINEDLTGITAIMHTYDVAYYDAQPTPDPVPDPTPDPAPIPSVDAERYRKIAALFREVASEFDFLADGK